MTETTTSSLPPRALIGHRLLALGYDLFPVVGIWFLVAAVFTLAHGDAVRGGWLGFGEFVALWLATGLYATASWRHGGQTLGMRPWKLKVVAANGGTPSWRAAWLRYAVGTLSLLLAGAGFWWAWFDRGKLAWHDRFSATRLVRT